MNWRTSQRSNICISGVPEEEKERTERVFK